MLSYFYQLAVSFELDHGLRPNRLYLNPTHLAYLKETFPDPSDFANILRLLEMELIIDREIVHPQVAWTSAAHRRAV
ncbi:MAG: hypothetical protein ACYDC8_12720 [Gammaproteobacteria bacterium]